MKHTWTVGTEGVLGLVHEGQADGRVGGLGGRKRGGPRVHEAQLAGLALLLSLLPPQRHLGRHDPLPLRDQGALGADTVPPATVALVSLERRDDAVVAAPRALGCPLVPLRGAQEERGRYRAQDRVQRHVHAAVCV